MYRKLLTITLTAAALSACGDKPDNAPQLVCNDPAVLQSVRNNIQGKSSNKKPRLRPKRQPPICGCRQNHRCRRRFGDQPRQARARNAKQHRRVQRHAHHPSARRRPFLRPNHSPLLYGSQSIDQLLQQRLGGSNLSYNGSGLFSQTLRYTPTAGESGTVVNYEDNSLTLAAQAVSTVLRPYGIKDILVINGQPCAVKTRLAPPACPSPSCRWPTRRKF